MNTKYFLLLIFFGFFSAAGAQTVKGTIKDKNSKELIVGANVYWQGASSGAFSDENGQFEIDLPRELPAMLIISFVGYNSDTLQVQGPGMLDVQLSSSIDMDEFVVEERKDAFSVSAATKLNTEEINRAVLRKAACCNLSESFETSASVDVVMNDAITGTRKIQMLGLDGIYVQNLFENVAFSRGLSNVLAFDQIPGPWLSSVQLTKGVGTVQNGYESMTGQINVEYIKPDTEPEIHLDFFANNQSRYEGNVIWTQPINDKWSTALFVNYADQQKEVDNNKDGFLDMPTRNSYNIMNRWKYKGEYLRSQIMLRYINEERNSGQVGYDHNRDYGTANFYGFGMDVEHAEAIWKMGILSKKREDQSLGLRAKYVRTDVDAYFGNNPYSGLQESARFTAIWTTKTNQFSDHTFNLGGQFVYDDISEFYDKDGLAERRRIERVPGVLAEYNYDRPRFSTVIGVRLDEHNIYGTEFTPRVHLKYNLQPLTTVRFSAGSGFRTPNVFADQLGMFASSRVISIQEDLDREKSWNFGGSFLKKFNLLAGEAVLNFNYYFTFFENQLVADRDFDPQQLRFYNLDGESTAHSFQGDFQVEVLKGLAVKASYKYQIVETDYIGGKLKSPLIPEHRALLNIGYTTPQGKWYFDLTGNYYGMSRLPSTASNPEEFQLGEKSETFFLVNGQITRIFGDLEVYVGAENLGNFIQEDAIVDAENPFGSHFDATMIYGPLNGRVIYGGIRYKLKLKNNEK